MGALEKSENGVDLAKSSAERRARRRSASVYDGLLHAAQSKAFGGLSPITQGLALLDWGLHLANAPFRRAELGVEAARGAAGMSISRRF